MIWSGGRRKPWRPVSRSSMLGCGVTTGMRGLYLVVKGMAASPWAQSAELPLAM